jgi:hypothetical protein
MILNQPLPKFNFIVSIISKFINFGKFKLENFGKFIWYLGFILTTLLVIFYIFQLNSVTEGMYLIKNYDKKIENLSQENKRLEIKFSKENSLENLGSLVENLGLNPVEKTDYIEIPDSTVLVK